MQKAAVTHIGLVREENQDRVIVEKLNNCILAAVFDGMGGQQGGKVASRIAEEEFVGQFQKAYESGMDLYALRNMMVSSVSAANSVIYTTARLDYKNYGMGTTCVAAFVDEEGISVVNVGDSRAYYYTKDGGLKQITKDHTVVNMLFEKGRITAEQRETHPQRHMLVRAVGVEKTVKPDYFRITHEKQFRLLLCSDGLCGFCKDAEIEEILSQQIDAQECVNRLLALALEKGGRDNVSIAVVSEW